METHLNQNPIKGKEFLPPGMIYAPYIPMVVTEPVDMWPGAKWAYDIVNIKEWLRRKKLESRYSSKTINHKFYKILNVSMEQNEDAIVMNVDIQPKQTLKSFYLDFKINDKDVTLDFPEDLPEL